MAVERKQIIGSWIKQEAIISFISHAVFPSYWHQQNFNNTCSAVGHKQCKDFSCFFYIFAIPDGSFCLLQLYPHFLAQTLSAGNLSRLQRVHAFGFTGYMFLTAASLRDTTHIIGYLSVRTGPKVAGLPLTGLHYFGLVWFMSNTDITGCKRDAKSRAYKPSHIGA